MPQRNSLESVTVLESRTVSDVVVGIGMRAGTTADVILAAIVAACGEQRVTRLATVDRRAGEAGLLGAASTLGVDIVSYTAAELAAVEVPNLAEHSLRTLGTPSVAEAAALLASGGGTLTVPKRVLNGVVVAVSAVAVSRPGTT